MPGLTDLEPPSTDACRAAERLAARYARPSLLHHARRSYLWGASLGDRLALPHDRELLHVAALLHDLGLEPAFDNVSLPFEDAGGHVAWAFGAGAGWPPERCDRVAEVVVRHMWDEVDVDEDVEGWLLMRATSMDISGTGAEDWPVPLQEQVLRSLPRLGLAADFAGCFAEQAARKPGSPAAAAVRSGIALRLRRNPLEKLAAAAPAAGA